MLLADQAGCCFYTEFPEHRKPVAETCVHVCVRHVLLYLHAMHTFRLAFLWLSGGPRLDLTPFSSSQLQLRRPPGTASLLLDPSLTELVLDLC